MIFPLRPPAIMSRTTAWDRKKTDFRLTFRTASQSSSVKSTASARRMIPALLTRMSMGPRPSVASFTMRAIGSIEPRSAWIEMAFTPLARHWPTVSSEARRATEAMDAPASASARAIP